MIFGESIPESGLALPVSSLAGGVGLSSIPAHSTCPYPVSGTLFTKSSVKFFKCLKNLFWIKFYIELKNLYPSLFLIFSSRLTTPCWLTREQHYMVFLPGNSRL